MNFVTLGIFKRVQLSGAMGRCVFVKKNFHEIFCLLQKCFFYYKTIFSLLQKHFFCYKICFYQLQEKKIPLKTWFFFLIYSEVFFFLFFLWNLGFTWYKSNFFLLQNCPSKCDSCDSLSWPMPISLIILKNVVKHGLTPNQLATDNLLVLGTL